MFFSMLQKIRIGGPLCSTKQELKKDAWQHPPTQPPANGPLFLQGLGLLMLLAAIFFACHLLVLSILCNLILDAVAVGKTEYSGNVEQDDISFPVTSLRENMVLMLYNADRELVSKTELKTQAIVESGTMDVVFALDTGGEFILQLQFLLSDDDRKRIQEMRYSAMKRKQQELRGDGYELNFPDSPSKRLIEKISNIQSKGDVPKLRKSMALDDLEERAVYSGINVDPCMKDSRDLLLQSSGTATSRSEDPKASKKGHVKLESGSSSSVNNASKKGHVKPESGSSSLVSLSKKGHVKPVSGSSSSVNNASKKGHVNPESGSSSSVKKMISAFENTSSQGLTSDSSASLGELDRTQTKKEGILPSSDKGSNYYRSGKHVLFRYRRPNASGQTGLSNASESWSRRSSSRDVARKQLRENGLSRSKRTSQAKQEQMRSMGHSKGYLEHPLNYLVATSSTLIHPHVCVTTASRQLKDLLELEHLNSPLTYIEGTAKSLVAGEDIEESTSDDESITPGRGGGGLPVLNGWLINQGVRAAIVIIACGAMFLNNR
ncbi:hypothetical protein ACP70R_033799 [Stipagrostis hirtigluma subsp. patula]